MAVLVLAPAMSTLTILRKEMRSPKPLLPSKMLTFETLYLAAFSSRRLGIGMIYSPLGTGSERHRPKART